MRIERLTISNFRGIPDQLDIEFDEENLALVGPNGAGKSSVMEALDYLLTGKIQALAGEGTGGISVRSHGPHIDADISDAWVEAEFSSPDDSVTLRRSLSNSSQTDPPKEDLPREFRLVLDSADRGLHLLSRSEILEFITSRNQTRSERIRSLLNLSGIQPRRIALQGARDDIEQTAERKERERSQHRQELLGLFGEEIESLDAIIPEINEIRTELGGSELETIESTDDLLSGLESPVELAQTNPLRSPRIVNLLERLQEWQEEGVDEFLEKIREFEQAVDEIRDDREAIRDLERLDLIERGRNAIDESAGQCPLCHREWDPDELDRYLEEREERAAQIRERRDDIEPQRDEALGDLTEVRTSFETLQDTLSQFAEFDTEWVGDAIDELSTVEAELERDLLDQRPSIEGQVDELRGRLARSEYTQRISALLSDSPTAEDLDRIESQWELLRDASSVYDDLETARVEATEYARSADEMDDVCDAFISARDDVLRRLYDDLEDRMDHFYQSIHPEEVSFSPDLRPTETGLDLQVGFHGRDTHPPHALHSEGHQDSMGLCLYLALCEWFQNDLPFIMLDDVVMSIDSGHRRPLADLLGEEISARHQLVIATHDDLWHRHLRSSGVVDGDHSIQFSDWSLTDGPRMPSHSGPEWDEIEALLEDGNVSGAAHRVRRTAEWFLREASHRLNARVRFKADGRWTLGDFKSGTQSKLKQVLRKAKSAEESWGHDISDIETLDEERIRIYQQLDEVSGTLNPNVHYNGDEAVWASCTAAELEPTVDAYKSFFDLLWCDTCNACMKVLTERHEEVMVRCNCGSRANWNLQGHSGDE